MGLHWFPIDAVDGLAVCGYAPVGPHDPKIVFGMAEATCADCKTGIQRRIEGTRVPGSRAPLRAVSGVC